MVKKVITNLNSSKASGPHCISVMVLKNYEIELSDIPAELFNMCLKEYQLVIPVFKNFGEGLQLKTTALLVFFSWLVESLKNL